MQREPQLSEAKQKLLEIQKRTGLVRPGATPEVNRRTREAPTPLSLAQEQVWRLDQIAAKLAPLHHESITIHRNGACDPAMAEACLVEIVRRHEIWRTTFEVANGKPIQVVHANCKLRLAMTDLRNVSTSDRDAKALQLATQDAIEPFDLSRGPLFRARLVTLDDNHHRLYLTAHQLLVDGITVFDVFPYEFTTLYENFAVGRPSPLAELETQYADFACWQRRHITNEMLKMQLAYWDKQVAGELPVLRWPNHGVRPARLTYRGALQPFALSEGLTLSLRELGRREGVTLFMVLLAAWVTLLYRYTKQEDIIVGTLAPCGRKRAEFQRLLGYFLNPVPLRANLVGNPAFTSLLEQMREVTLGAISHDDVPLELIAERLRLTPDPSRPPFFTVALSVAPDVAPLPPGWSMTYMDVESGGARWDLYLEMNDRAGGMIGRAQYNPDLFTSSTITQTLEDFRVLLEKIVAVPSQRISELAQ
jgi:Condensation domain